MWHASVASQRRRLAPQTLREIAIKALEGVGDATLGQWEKWTGRAYHIRRRLTPQEAIGIEPVVDIRGTPEAERRYQAIRDRLSPQVRHYAEEELASKESPYA